MQPRVRSCAVDEVAGDLKAVVTTPDANRAGNVGLRCRSMSLKQRATEAFETVEAELGSMSKWMYENPELGFQEVEASKRLAGFLADHGFEVSHPAYDIETAFEARAGRSGPRVVICAEYDALPGVGHACGHNIIATSSVGAGVALADLVDELGIRSPSWALLPRKAEAARST
jgi:hypothetical protein